MSTLYTTVSLRPVSWDAVDGTVAEYQYANSSRPSRSECDEEIPSGADVDHPAMGCVQQEFGSVVSIIDRGEDVAPDAVVAIEFDDD